MAEQTKNPKNSENLLFKRLTRLLSGPLVNYRTQTGRRLRRIDLDNFASRFKSASGKQFKKMAYDPFSNLQTNVMQGMQRTERYVDFDQMEYTPEIASALDIYADEMTTSSNLNPLMNIHCPNEEIKSILHTLYHDIMNVEFNLFGWSRTMCKYGDFFLYLDMDEDRGIQNVIGLPSTELERLEGEDKTNPNYVQFQWNSVGMTFENWQIAHFRVLGNDKYSPYGSSVLEPARRIWRQLTLLEDAMMAYRIVRSPERRVFYIEVGNIPPQDVEQYMQKIMTQMKRHQVVDPDTGRVDLRYNPLSIDEDYFIPTRAGQNSRVESLPGGTYTGDIDDVKYLRDKLFAALKVPQSYLSRGEGSEEDKTTLAQKDIRFARTIQRLQRSIVSELEKIGIIHLYILGFRDDDLVSFKLSLNNPSKIAELQELEHWKTKFETASSATEGFFSRRWISKNLFNMSDEEFLRNQREMFFDRQYDASLESVAEQVQAELSPDAAAGGTGTTAMEDELLGTDDAATDEPAETTPDTGGEPEIGDLLATPGKRNDEPRKSSFADGSTTTDRSKGKRYTPVKNKSKSGYKTQNTKGLYNRETAKATRRNMFPGLSDFDSLARGIFEEGETNYSEEEKNIFSLNNEVKKIVESINFEDIKK